MPAAVAAVLRALRTAQAASRLAAGARWADHGLVFPGGFGEPGDRPAVLEAFKDKCEAAGFGRDWTLRELRHTFVSVLSDSGTDIELISDAVGHVNSGVTRTVYRHQIADKISAAATVMDGVFG